MAIANTLPRSDLHARGSWFGFVLACNIVGFLSAMVPDVNQGAFYRSLELPSWAPPPQLFAPVWTVLYTLMGLGTYLVARDAYGPARRTALIAFGVQLALNALWTPVFFGLGWIGPAFVLIVAILAATTFMAIAYHRVSRQASALVTPIVAWVAFAAALNGAIWVLN
jgi:tryptophan-rich sensory protein